MIGNLPYGGLCYVSGPLCCLPYPSIHVQHMPDFIKHIIAMGISRVLKCACSDVVRGHTALFKVGTNEGQAAAVWGQELKKNSGLLVCFDTWVVDLAMQLSETWREVMGWQVGSIVVVA